MNTKNRVVISIEGGLVQAVFADRPEEIAVVRLDYDTEGSDASDGVKLLAVQGAEPLECFADEYPIDQLAPHDAEEIFRVAALERAP